MPDFRLYDLLEVSPQACEEVINVAYTALKHKLNPTLHPENAELLSHVREAHRILSDPAERASYDHERTNLLGKTFGQYRILREIAEGGFGKTYLGEHVILKEPVCIKHCSEISTVYNEVLIKEARSMWDLRHYSIPSIRDLIRIDDGSMILVMSYIPGLTLEQIVEKHGRLGAEDVAWITERVLNALSYIHHHGVLHGDLKPANIIVQDDRHMAVIVDFGLAMIKPTKDSKSIGFTEDFAPPEEVRRLPLVPESDLYSLGMTMIYALSGDLRYVQRKEVPSTVPDALKDFIRRLTRTEVLSRPSWKEDLTSVIKDIRVKSFGRASSGMKPLGS